MSNMFVYHYKPTNLLGIVFPKLNVHLRNTYESPFSSAQIVLNSVIYL